MSTSQKAQVHESASVIEKFSMLPPEQFGEQIDQVWRALTEITKTVVNEVESTKHLSPDDGRRAIASLSASLLGYQQDQSGQGSYMPNVALQGSSSRK